MPFFRLLCAVYASRAPFEQFEHYISIPFLYNYNTINDSRHVKTMLFNKKHINKRATDVTAGALSRWCCRYFCFRKTYEVLLFQIPNAIYRFSFFLFLQPNCFFLHSQFAEIATNKNTRFFLFFFTFFFIAYFPSFFLLYYFWSLFQSLVMLHPLLM